MGIGIAMLGVWSDHKRKPQIAGAESSRTHGTPSRKASSLPPLPKADFVVVSDRPEDGSARMLRCGVLLLGLGIVLYFAINEAGGHEGALFGFIPATLGLANLAYAVVLFNSGRVPGSDRSNDHLRRSSGPDQSRSASSARARRREPARARAGS